ncbi:MAG: hypothetical protein ABEI13_02010 [Candidatus Paceibacteria bacterium]
MDNQYTEWINSIAKPEWFVELEILGKFWFGAYPLALFGLLWMRYMCINRELPRRLAIPIVMNILVNIGFEILTTLYLSLTFLGVILTLHVITIGWIIILLLPYIIWIILSIIAQVELLRLN